MTTELATVNSMLPTATEFDTMLKIAQAIATSGLAPSEASTKEKVLVIMLKARELGVPPMQALSTIYVVKGRPTLSADLMVALLRRAGHKVWPVENTDKKCVMRGIDKRNPEHTFEATFTWEDAVKAKLTGKDTWQSYPKQLLYARCAAMICRQIAPDVLAGLYTPEELGAETTITEDGQEVIVSTPQQTVEVATGEVIEAEPAVDWAMWRDRYTNATTLEAVDKLDFELKALNLPPSPSKSALAAWRKQCVKAIGVVTAAERAGK